MKHDLKESVEVFKGRNMDPPQGPHRPSQTGREKGHRPSQAVTDSISVSTRTMTQTVQTNDFLCFAGRAKCPDKGRTLAVINTRQDAKIIGDHHRQEYRRYHREIITDREEKPLHSRKR